MSPISRRRFLGQAALAAAGVTVGTRLAAPEVVRASTDSLRFAIIANLTHAQGASAQLDMSMDTRLAGVGPVPIVVSTFDSQTGNLVTSFSVSTNSNGFASTATASSPNDNLFTAAGADLALIEARDPVPSGDPNSTAMLRQRTRGQSMILGIPVSTTVASTQLAVAIGDIGKGISLLIANVTQGQLVAADIFVGTVGAPGTGKYSNPALPPMAVWQVDLQATDANSNLVIASSGSVIAQLVGDDGALETMIYPV